MALLGHSRRVVPFELEDVPAMGAPTAWIRVPRLGSAADGTKIAK